MSWLKKAGQIFLTGAKIAAGIAPMLPVQGQTRERLQDTLGSIMGAVVVAEVLLGPGTGPQKLERASLAVAQAIIQSPFMDDKEIADKQAFAAAVEKITAGAADLANSLKEK